MTIPRRELIDALINAFGVIAFDRMLLTRLNRNRELIIAGVANTTLEDIVSAVVVKAERRGWIVDLIRGALEDAPGNPQLNAFLLRYPYLNPATAPPAGRCYHSMLLKSQRVFLQRDDFRDALQIIGTPNQSRVMAIDGERHAGKTYSTEFLYFLRENEPSWAGTDQQVIYVSLDEGVFEPEDLVRVLGRRLGLDEATIPPNKGEQAPRRIPDLIDWLTRGIQAAATDVWWIVLDGFRVQVQSGATHDLIRALIYATDRDWDRARLVLLNYKDYFDLDTPNYILREEIKSVGRADIEEFFEHVYATSKKTWLPADIKQTVDSVLQQVDAETAKRGADAYMQLLSIGLTKAARNLLS